MIQEYEIKEYLSKKDLDEIAEKQLKELLLLNPALKRCPCGAIMEVLQGEVNLKAKDDKGDEISHQSAIHYSLYRVRCGECKNTFCSECRS